MKLYQRLAEHYFSLEANGRDFYDEIESLDALFSTVSARDVIDLGCGTGEHVNALADKGYNATGLDISTDMIRVARKRYKNRNFLLGDMSVHRPARIYDAAFCIFGSFDYFLKDEDMLRAFTNIRAMLRPGGILALEVWNAAPLKRIRSKELSPITKIKNGGTELSRDRGFVLLNADPALVQVNYVYVLNKEEIRDRHHMRAFECDEIMDYALRAGFSRSRPYSDLKGNPYKSTSSRIGMVLRSR